VVAQLVEAVQGRAGDGGLVELDDGQLRAVRAVGDHHAQVGDGGIRHRPLAAADPRAVDGGRPGGVRRAAALGPGQGGDPLARGESRQPARLLLVAAGQRDGLGSHAHGGEERHRCHRAAELLADHGQLHDPEPDTAVGFGDGGAAQPELGHGPPQRLVPTLAVGDQPAQGFRRRLLFQQVPHLIPQQSLFFRQHEWHVRIP
jgi:hypothetical protein